MSTGTSLLLAFSETFDQSPWSHIRKGHLEISARRFGHHCGALGVLLGSSSSTFGHVPTPFYVPFPRCFIMLAGASMHNERHLDISTGRFERF